MHGDLEHAQLEGATHVVKPEVVACAPCERLGKVAAQRVAAQVEVLQVGQAREIRPTRPRHESAHEVVVVELQLDDDAFAVVEAAPRHIPRAAPAVGVQHLALARRLARLAAVDRSTRPLRINVRPVVRSVDPAACHAVPVRLARVAAAVGEVSVG